MKFKSVGNRRPGRKLSAAILAVPIVLLVGCGKTGHLAEVTIKPGIAVTGRNGLPVEQLATSVQQQLAADIRRCTDEATVTIPDDRLALVALVGAASGVLQAHGGVAKTQGGLNGAANAMDQETAAEAPMRQEVTQAAEWKASDCLKSEGWDAVPRFMSSNVKGASIIRRI
jgi:hypothetical protein